MFIHLGQETVVKQDEVVGIFDMDNTTISKHTRKFLNFAEKRGEVVNITYELPKSFVVTNTKKGKKIHISPVSVGTILKRTESKIPT